MAVLWIQHLILAKKFLIWEKTKRVQLERMFVAKLCSFPLSFMACYKNWLFLILYEKCRMFSCTTCLMTLPCPWLWTSLTCWDRCQSSPGSHQIIWEFFFDQNDQNGTFAIYFCNHHWIHQTLLEFSALSSDWHPNTVKYLCCFGLIFWHVNHFRLLMQNQFLYI